MSAGDDGTPRTPPTAGFDTQLLIQMLDGNSRDMRAGFERMERKLGEMIPRPEFLAYQKAVADRHVQMQGDLQQSLADHAKIRSEMDVVNTRAETLCKALGVEIDRTRDSIADANQRIGLVNEERLREFRSINLKMWGALGVALLSVIGGVILRSIP